MFNLTSLIKSGPQNIKCSYFIDEKPMIDMQSNAVDQKFS